MGKSNRIRAKRKKRLELLAISSKLDSSWTYYDAPPDDDADVSKKETEEIHRVKRDEKKSDSRYVPDAEEKKSTAAKKPSKKKDVEES